MSGGGLPIALLQAHVADALDSIRIQFRDRVHLTLIVRNPGHEGGERDVIITDDTLDGIQAALDRAGERELRAQWAKDNPGEEHPGCTTFTAGPCVSWAREGACPHVPRAFWRSP